MLATHYCGEGGSNPRGRQMRRLTENEIRQFYEAYREMEARARVYHRVAVRHLIQLDFMFFALVVVVFLSVLLYPALL
jgi:hypothetical protein